MIATGFKSVAWVGGIGSAALVCYMFSMQVAEERASLAQLEAQIRRTEVSIQTLKVELNTRGRVHQLQHWASSDFGFTSPKAAQFLDDEVKLASLQSPQEAPMEEPVRVADAPAAPADLPKPVQAAAPAPAPQRPVVRQASAPSNEAQRTLLRRAAVEQAPRATPKPSKPASPPSAKAEASRPLVSARALQAIDQGARAESRVDRAAPRPAARPAKPAVTGPAR